MARAASPVIDVTETSGAAGLVARTLAGMGVTLTRMVRSVAGREHVTIEYPEQRKPYSRRFRGTCDRDAGTTTYGIQQLTQRPEIEGYGAGYRLHPSTPWWRATSPGPLQLRINLTEP